MKATLRNLFIVLCVLLAPAGVEAQTLVFHLAGGAKSTVSLPATFTVTPTDDKLIVDGGGLYFESESASKAYGSCFYGRSVRPVLRK